VSARSSQERISENLKPKFAVSTLRDRPKRYLSDASGADSAAMSKVEGV
jgi:hypothetical protein